jgi:hypothetical protein
MKKIIVDSLLWIFGAIAAVWFIVALIVAFAVCACLLPVILLVSAIICPTKDNVIHIAM